MSKPLPSREEALDELLKPITWSMSSSIRARQNHVTACHQKVVQVLPFLTLPELMRVRKWQKDNAHTDLWD